MWSSPGVARYPVAAKTSDRRNIAAVAVCVDLRRFSMSFAPKYWEMTTLAPIVKPIARPIRVITIGIVEVTAPSASAPTKFPTTMLSTVLYSCWNMFPMNRGKANFTRCFQIVPSVMSLTVLCGKEITPFFVEIVGYEQRGVKYLLGFFAVDSSLP